jgi:hypothetical protein
MPGNPKPPSKEEMLEDVDNSEFDRLAGELAESLSEC